MHGPCVSIWVYMDLDLCSRLHVAPLALEFDVSRELCKQYARSVFVPMKTMKRRLPALT